MCQSRGFLAKTEPVIDTHCHLDVSAFDADRDQVLHRAFAEGVTGIVVPAISPESWNALIQWPKTDARIQVALGIHPQYLPQIPFQDDSRHLETLDSMLSQGSIVAVGECGLDGGTAEVVPMERQLEILKIHFDLAKKHKLPLLMHCLKAHNEFQRFLKANPIPEEGLLMHSYSGTGDVTEFYIEAGCHFSFTGPLTYHNARKAMEALKLIPHDRLMIESDAPDQSPEPLRQTRNEPKNIVYILKAMAQVLGIEEKRMKEITTQNAQRFFNSFQGDSP
jgi:TatD DNase family protein